MACQLHFWYKWWNSRLLPYIVVVLLTGMFHWSTFISTYSKIKIPWYFCGFSVNITLNYYYQSKSNNFSYIFYFIAFTATTVLKMLNSNKIKTEIWFSVQYLAFFCINNNLQNANSWQHWQYGTHWGLYNIKAKHKFNYIILS